VTYPTSDLLPTVKLCNFFFHGTTASSRLGAPHYRGFTITIS